MNIFELILSEPQSYQPTDFAGQVGSWTSFRNNISALFGVRNDPETLLARSKELWMNVRKNCPELIPVMIDYYLSTCPCMQTNWKRLSMAHSPIPSAPSSPKELTQDNSHLLCSMQSRKCMHCMSATSLCSIR